jgi:cyclopropane-fatty-acyl-phospholipid synthase
LVEDWQNFGSDYDRTLMAWQANVEKAWPELEPHLGDLADAEHFRRFWRYYLLCCAGFFRSRQGQLWQLVLSRSGLANLSRRSPYRSVRVGPCPLAPTAGRTPALHQPDRMPTGMAGCASVRESGGRPRG